VYCVDWRWSTVGRGAANLSVVVDDSEYQSPSANLWLIWEQRVAYGYMHKYILIWVRDITSSVWI